ncbi:MAG TPA: carboxymuconolactone decarboxylase family protein, partial [Planctomycetota bacterium]|nr:carboxymuconolactone decarboxylase family protein [Planctomycetota bacterium]
GCGRCLAAHERTLREHGVRPETIHDAVRTAAVAHAVAVALAVAVAEKNRV